MYVLLFCYHLIFIAFAYWYRLQRGTSDAHLYWGKKFDINDYSWFDFASYGTNFILFLNYPFIKLGFPFWSGFLIYGTIGFLGILKWMQWTEKVFGEKLYFRGVNVLPMVFFLPNLHIWTAALGKEAIVFWGIASVFYAFSIKKHYTFSAITGVLVVFLIRPHVALMLLSAFVIVLFFNSNYSFKKRITIAFISVFIVSVLVYMVFQLSKIRYWNWNRIKYYNDYSILSFNDSGSYVPMLEYNYGYKLFSFNFRPLFFDANSILQYLASIENILLLFIHLLALFFVLRFYSKIEFQQWIKITFLFTLISSLLFVQRYANLGIFMRTKMMFQPFMLIALLCIIKQGLNLNNSKS